MANICIGCITMRGNHEDVKKLYSTMEFCKNENEQVPLDLIPAPEEDKDEYIDYYLTDPEIDGDEICFEAELPWNDNAKRFQEIADEYNLKWAGLFSNDEDGYWAINDGNSDIFRNNYILDAEGSPIGSFEEFQTEEELVLYLKEKTGVVKSAEEWASLFYDCYEIYEMTGNADWNEDSYARLWKVERYDYEL